MNPALIHAAIAFWRTKRLARRLRTRADVLAWRAARLDRFVRTVIPHAPYYASLHATRLEDLPIIDKATHLACFHDFNTRGVSSAQVRAALDDGRERIGGLIIGQSTGTSGNRGVYIISEAERFTWLGVLLAKALPDFPFTRHKVALALPGANQLYASANETGRLSLRFFDLGRGLESWRDALVRFQPDTIVAPPKVLRALAGTPGLGPTQLFSGAEVLDPLDRAAIEAGFGVRVREIYMATEGLFGVGCTHGTLHLAEDVVAFEFEAVGEGLVSPLITDFTRTTQIMARYRMNDLLRLDDAMCACGSPLQSVASVVGRQDDVFLIPDARGALVMVTPDVLRNAVVDSDRRIVDFRIVQVEARRIVLSLARDLPAEAGAYAADALKRAFAKAGAGEVEITLQAGIEAVMDRKLRRVRRGWAPATNSV